MSGKAVEIRVTREVDLHRVLSGSLRTFFEDVMMMAHADVAQPGVVPIDTGLLASNLAPGGAGAAVTHVDSANPPTYAQVGTVIPYGRILDESERTHYRGGPSGGKPTKGWLSDVKTRTRDEFERLVSSLADDIEAGWQR